MQKCLGQILCCRWTEVAVAPDAIDIYVCHAYTVCTVLYCTVHMAYRHTSGRHAT